MLYVYIKKMICNSDNIWTEIMTWKLCSKKWKVENLLLSSFRWFHSHVFFFFCLTNLMFLTEHFLHTCNNLHIHQNGHVFILECCDDKHTFIYNVICLVDQILICRITIKQSIDQILTNKNVALRYFKKFR